MWLVPTSVTVAHVVRHGARVQKNPDRSIVGLLPGDREQGVDRDQEPPALTGLHKAVLIAFHAMSGDVTAIT